MRGHQLTALILASALITLDGTAATIALPAIGHDLSAPVSRLQWIANAPLLALAALLLPAGTIGDRFGHVRVLRTGLLVFVSASLVCAAAWSDAAVIVTRLGQGAGGALILPAALAILSGAYVDPAERTRMFGVWAAWTGAAGVAGPLLAGLLVDVMSWRAVFLPSAVVGLVSLMLLKADSSVKMGRRSDPVPGRAMAALIVLFGASAYVLMAGSQKGVNNTFVLLAAALAIMAGVMFRRAPRRQILFPRELLHARNCLRANAVTFGLYFGMFGLSFLLVLYVQQVLRHSAVWAAIVVLPISIMLLFAERFGRLTSTVGTRWVTLAGALPAAGGIGWIASADHPVPFWTHMIAGAMLFGLGMSVTVSAVTHATVAAVPDDCAGAASGLNHAVVRAAGLTSIALLGSIAAPGASEVISADGFQQAVLLCAGIVAAGGVAGGASLRDDKAGGVTPAP